MIENRNNCSNYAGSATTVKSNPRDNPVLQMLNRQKTESIRRKRQQRDKEYIDEFPDRTNMSERERLALFRVHRRRRPTQFQAAIG